MELQNTVEIIKGEGLKTAAELALYGLSRSHLGSQLIEAYAFGSEGRIIHPSLHTTVAGIEFENPILFGAGWDKKGRAINGLYELGFAGGDVGTVLPFGQYGNPKPRIWTINAAHSVGINRLGFNSPGEDVVEQYLSKTATDRFPIGLNVGKNKILPNEFAHWSHAEVIKRLGKYAAYIVLGISSPNTADLRGLQDKEPFRENVQAAQEAIRSLDLDRNLPLFIKIDGERTESAYDDMIEVMLEEGGAGFIAINTYMGQDFKAKYGKRWGSEAGGLSGADPDYRRLANKTVRYLYEQAGDKLDIIGVGGVNNAETTLEMVGNGGSAVQVVTAIRPSKGKVAATTARDLVQYMEREGVTNITELIGINTNRGAKAA